jgi:hypothetical protein
MIVMHFYSKQFVILLSKIIEKEPEKEKWDNVPDTPGIALIVSCTPIWFACKRDRISASSNIGKISDSVFTLLLSDVASEPSMVDCSKCTTSGSKAVEVEDVEVEDVEVEAAEVEAAEVEAAEVEAAEV